MFDTVNLDGKSARDGKRGAGIVAGGHHNGYHTNIGITGGTAQGLGDGVKGEPCAGITAGAAHAGTVGEHGPFIGIVEGIHG